jgi:hypothetical protein
MPARVFGCAAKLYKQRRPAGFRLCGGAGCSVTKSRPHLDRCDHRLYIIIYNNNGRSDAPTLVTSSEDRAVAVLSAIMVA